MASYRLTLCPACGWPVERESGRCRTIDCTGEPHGVPRDAQPKPVRRRTAARPGSAGESGEISSGSTPKEG
jgi:hypothetical protein